MSIVSEQDWRECGLRERRHCEQVLSREADGVGDPMGHWQPRKVFLFSGHLVDAPQRPQPRFPADKVPQAQQKIAAALAANGAGPQDIAFTQGACGGDLLFSEACHQRGPGIFWLQPQAEPEFLQVSVVVGGADWLPRYHAARATLVAPPRSLDTAGAPAGGSIYERCNLWLLYTALAWGADRLTLVCLWNGAGAEGVGGTGHMVEAVRQHRGTVIWIDSRTL